MGLKNVIEHSIAASGSEVTREFRKRQVLSIEPRFKRMVIQSIDLAVFALPSGIFTLDQAEMRRHGYPMIGSGVESQVFSNGEHVMKYVRRSDRLSSAARQELRDKKAKDFDRLQAYMSDFVLDQTISIAPHVVKKDREVVQTVQPLVSFDHIVDWFDETGEFRIDESNNQLLDGLSDFVDASWRFIGEAGLYPDIAGPDNLVTVENQVILLDTQPIKADMPQTQDLIHRQLGSITALIDKLS